MNLSVEVHAEILLAKQVVDAHKLALYAFSLISLLCSCSQVHFCMCVCCHKWPLLFTRLFENKTQHCSPSPHACSSLYNYATRNACLMCSLTVRETSYIFMIYEKSEVLTETNTEHYLWVE